MITAPESYIPILGTPFVRELTDPKFPILRIGRDSWTKHEVAVNLGIVQTKACSILTGICKKLQIASTAELYKTTSPYTFADFPAGVTTLYVMFAAFADKGLDPQAWYAKGQEAAIVSFISLKHRELEANKRTREDEKRRKRSISNRNHRSDVNRVLNGAGA
jgi:hypothetical protein